MRKYKWFIIGGAVTIILILILALSLGGNKDKKPQPVPPEPTPVPPGPTPPGPVPEWTYNPYEVDQGTLMNYESSVTGKLIFAKQVESEKFLDLFTSYIYLTDSAAEGSPASNYTVNPRYIPKGKNNKLIEKVNFEFGQSTQKISYVKFSNADLGGYTVPSDLVN